MQCSPGYLPDIGVCLGWESWAAGWEGSHDEHNPSALHFLFLWTKWEQFCALTIFMPRFCGSCKCYETEGGGEAVWAGMSWRDKLGVPTWESPSSTITT